MFHEEKGESPILFKRERRDREYIFMTQHDAFSKPFCRVKKQLELLTFNKFSSTLPGVNSSSDVAKLLKISIARIEVAQPPPGV